MKHGVALAHRLIVAGRPGRLGDEFRAYGQPADSHFGSEAKQLCTVGVPLTLAQIFRMNASTGWD